MSTFFESLSTMTPLLSICIPTYNRATHLESTLNSIASQKIFTETDLIEVIIADNQSSDDTNRIVMQFTERYKGKILYRLNSDAIAKNKNAGDLNAINVLKMGKGAFLKLQNDNLGFLQGSLEYIIHIIKKTFESKPPIFFKNFGDAKDPIVRVNSLDQFIQEASYWTGWFGGFGIWKDTLDSTSDFGRLFSENIFTADEYFRMVIEKKSAIIVRTKLFAGSNVGKKSGYSLSKVYGTNYVNLLKKLMKDGFISPNILAKEKRDVYEKHIVPYFFNTTHGFKIKGFFREMKNYWDEEYFQALMDSALLAFEPNRNMLLNNQSTIEEKSSLGQPNLKQEEWRNSNLHNGTTISNVREPNKVKVGNYSYGPLNVYSWNNDDEFLEIGHFVSIADSVEFLLGGNHKSHFITNFPVRAIFLKTQRNEALTKGKITVKDDVWIGHGATILSGVTIGQGAIVGAKSVVTKDVEPYSIVAGNPANIIGYRFDSGVIEYLKKIDFSKVTPNMMIENINEFESSPSETSVDKIIQIINNSCNL